MNMKKFLVIQTAFLGDAVLATALLEKLHRFFPDAAVDLVVRKGNEGLFEEHPFLRRVHVWDKGTNKTRDLFRIIREVRKERYDHVITCQRFFSTGLMAVMARAKETIGYDKNPLAPFISRLVKHRIPLPSEIKPHDPSSPGDHPHEVDRLNDLIEHLTDKSRPLPRLYPSERHVQQAHGHMGTWAHGHMVVIAPASVWYTKQWPAEKWVELIQALPSDRRVVLIGAKGDVPLCEGIVRDAGRGEVLAGKLSLLATAALMRDASMNYVNDSAPLHIASAMNAPVTAVFCSTVPAFGFGPLGERSRIAQVNEPLYCRPCGLHGRAQCPEGHFRCALDIRVAALG